MKKILNIVIAFVIAFSAVGCKDYFDINYDPNIPATENITNSMILPGVEGALATSYGDFLRITGGYFSEHYAQTFGTSNYVGYSQFSMSASQSSRLYTQLFQKVLVNSKTIMDRAVESKNYGDYIAAASLFAFTYQTLVDCYGEVPYTQAFDSDQYMAPAYDNGDVVYNGILATLDDALAKVGDGQPVAKNLLYPGGNSTDWIKFANTVKLKILSRMSKVSNSQAALDALIAEDNFITSDAQYAGCWANAETQASPFYSEEFAPWHSQDNVVANAALVAAMQFDTYTDPRLGVWFKKNNSGKYVGAISGCNLGSTASSPYNSAAGLCRPNITFDTPVSLISVAEVEFFKSEYYAGKDNAKAEEHYKKAIKASFASAGLTEDDAEENIEMYPFDKDNSNECIGIAKWIALSGCNNFESWCELRRLGYPEFGPVKGSDLWTGTDVSTSAVNALIPGTIYTPYQVFAQVGEGNVLERWPYADSSQSRNSNCPQFPGYTTPVFWAK
ncbi:MAG: SusD/RagB family nutrient-binding outer membrane lipoprotein [Bacteroidaceae bacterium]|nr:SusD/RagB family nutrient-binding outer membrane lipoprotein [Bacteroidaceae bacterium]